MPGLMVTIGGNSTPFTREVARAEAVALGFSKNLNRQVQAQAAASMANLKSQMAVLEAFKAKVATLNGTSMMSDKESAAKDEAVRLVEVEEAARNNAARRLWRKRKADAASSAAQIAEAELAAQVEVATRSNLARKLWRERGERRAAKAAAAAEEIAATKAAQLAEAAVVARGYGSNVATGSHGKTGAGGVVAETAVIGHEVLQGRGTGRILGSISILGQRLGWLRKIIKTTADADIDAAKAAGKVSQQLSAKAIQLEAVAIASEAAGSASAVADRAAATAALADAVAQETKTKALVQQAEIARANATLLPSLGGTIFGGLVAAAVAAVAVYYYFEHRVNRLAKALGQLERPDLTPVKLDKLTSAEEGWKKIRDAVREAANAYNSATAQSDRHLESLHEIFAMEKRLLDLRNGSKAEQHALEVSQNEREIQAMNERLEGIRKENAAKQEQVDALAHVPTSTAFRDKEENLHNANEVLQAQLKEAQEEVDKAEHPGIGGKTWNAIVGTARFFSGGQYSPVQGGAKDDAAVIAGASEKAAQAAEATRKFYEFEKTKLATEDKIKERDRLQDEIAKNSAEMQTLQDKLKDLPGQQAQKLDIADKLRNAQRAGGTASVTERERIGLGAASSIQVSILDVAKQHKQISVQQLAAMQQMVKEISEGGW